MNEKNIVQIFEACTFQDVTGQRIRKVVGSLKAIDEKTCEADVGIVVFRLIKGVVIPTKVSIPKVKGVTSSKTISLTSPVKTAP